MAPTKKEDIPEYTLARARVKRDIALKSIQGIYTTALEARADASLLPSLCIRAEDLNMFVDQFLSQQDSIINSLIDLNQIDDLELTDHPHITSMESMRFEIKNIVARVFWILNRCLRRPPSP